MQPPFLKSGLFCIPIVCLLLSCALNIAQATSSKQEDPIARLESLYGPDADRNNDTGVLAVELRNDVITACSQAAQDWATEYVPTSEEQAILAHCQAFQKIEGIRLDLAPSSPATQASFSNEKQQEFQTCRDHTLSVGESYVLNQGKEYTQYETLTEYYENLLKWLGCINHPYLDSKVRMRRGERRITVRSERSHVQQTNIKPSRPNTVGEGTTQIYSGQQETGSIIVQQSRQQTSQPITRETNESRDQKTTTRENNESRTSKPTTQESGNSRSQNH